MRAVIIGVVLAVVLAAAAVITPIFLRSEASLSAVAARKAAQEAESTYDRYVAALPPVAAAADPNALQAADLAAIAEQTNADFSPGAATQAIRQFVTSVGENRNLLNRAKQDASQAMQQGRTVRGVGQVMGAIELGRAKTEEFAARRLRREAEALLTQLIDRAVDYKRVQAEVDEYAGADVTDVLSRLQGELQAVDELRSNADRAAADLRDQVDRRQKEIQQVNEQIATAQQQRDALEKDGFKAGDDASFKAYRDEYERLSNELAQAQERQQRLTEGGLDNGARVLPLETLQARLAVEQDKVARFADARKRLEQQAAAVTKAGEQAQALRGEFTNRMNAVRGDVETLKKAVFEKLAEARTQDDSAVQAAESAVNAYRAAQQAASAEMQAAREQQQKYDPKRVNERLKLVLADDQMGNIGTSGEADAKALIGQILADRADALETVSAGLDKVMALVPDLSYEREELQKNAAEARASALKALDDARNSYDKLARGNVGWLAQGASAAADYYAALAAEPGDRAALLARALQTVNSAIANREKSPYVAPLGSLRVEIERALVAAGGVPPTPAAPENGVAPTEPAPTEPEAQG